MSIFLAIMISCVVVIVKFFVSEFNTLSCLSSFSVEFQDLFNQSLLSKVFTQTTTAVELCPEPNLNNIVAPLGTFVSK